MSHQCQVLYYTKSNHSIPFRVFLLSLTPSSRTKVIRLLQQFEKYGLIGIGLHSKKITNTPLWELKIVGKISIRIIYGMENKNVLILHGFIKKTQKTPIKHILISINRYKDWISRS